MISTAQCEQLPPAGSPSRPGHSSPARLLRRARPRTTLQDWAERAPAVSVRGLSVERLHSHFTEDRAPAPRVDTRAPRPSPRPPPARSTRCGPRPLRRGHRLDPAGLHPAPADRAPWRKLVRESVGGGLRGGVCAERVAALAPGPDPEQGSASFSVRSRALSHVLIFMTLLSTQIHQSALGRRTVPTAAPGGWGRGPRSANL